MKIKLLIGDENLYKKEHKDRTTLPPASPNCRHYMYPTSDDP